MLSRQFFLNINYLQFILKLICLKKFTYTYWINILEQASI